MLKHNHIKLAGELELSNKRSCLLHTHIERIILSLNYLHDSQCITHICNTEPTSVIKTILSITHGYSNETTKIKFHKRPQLNWTKCSVTLLQ